jgi:hypothetical protein
MKMLIRRGRFRKIRKGIHAVLRCARARLARAEFKVGS